MALLDWFKATPRPDPTTLLLIERAVVAIDPLLKSQPGHERKLAPAIRHAFEYCEQLALAIPGPIPITRVAFATEPLVHALFASADDIGTMLARSQCVRTHLVHMPELATGQCCALLGMRHREKACFGARMTGEVVQIDQAQKTLYFTDHTLAEPSPDLAGAHRRLADRMFDSLIKGFVDHVAEVRIERQELREQHALARVLEAEPTPQTRRQSDLHERLRETADALQAPQLIETLVEYLAKPESSLRLDPVEISVDRGGVIVATPDDEMRTDKLRFVELTTRDLRRWVVMIVSIDRDEARAAVERLDEARRHIIF